MRIDKARTEVRLLKIVIECERTFIPYIVQPITPIVKITYIGREIAVAGAGRTLQIVKICGTNADVVHIPESIPRISIRFIFKPFFSIHS
jgi:hypothetical protein